MASPPTATSPTASKLASQRIPSTIDYHLMATTLNSTHPTPTNSHGYGPASSPIVHPLRRHLHRLKGHWRNESRQLSTLNKFLKTYCKALITYATTNWWAIEVASGPHS
ncbi:unnamed protein product, partial [Protopolystoma xenopodis]